MSQEPHIHIHDEGTKESRARIFIRIAVIVAMIVVLFLIAVAIVRYVPKFISSFGQANVSLTSLFGGNTATTTPSTTGTETGGQSSYNATNYGATATSTYGGQNQFGQGQNANTKPSGSYTAPKPYYYTYNGPADLAINLVKVGRILPDGTFQSTSNLAAGDRVTVQFRVSNVGSGKSGAWTLSAVLPTIIASEQNYISTTQPSLNPGDSYIMTLAFDSFDASRNSILITINGADSNQGNNILTVPVTGSGTNIPSNNCYLYNGQHICGTGGIYGGLSDLAITVTNVGYMDAYSGQFYPSGNLYAGQKVAVQFEVKNIGGAYSGTWSFSANMPSNYQSNYYSGMQNSLAPGQVQTFTLGFTNPRSGSQNFSVQLNPMSGDANSSNNYASRTLYIGY